MDTQKPYTETRAPRREPRGQQRALGTALAAMILWIEATSSSAAAPAPEKPAEPGTKAPAFVSARPGWYVSLGLIGAHLDLDMQDPEPFGTIGIDVDETGSGVHLQLGYAFTPSFALEVSLKSTEHDTRATDVGARFHQVQIDAVAPLRLRGRVRPYLAGGVGGAGLELFGSGIDDTTISGAQIDMGAGVEVHASRHLAFSLNYRYAIQDFKEKTIRGGEGAGDFDFEGTGASHDWGLRLTWSF
ncbi:MAG: outer membrane beta-barrel protein [Candidatus Krumholzibacteriia bacterium]